MRFFPTLLPSHVPAVPQRLAAGLLLIVVLAGCDLMAPAAPTPIGPTTQPASPVPPGAAGPTLTPVRPSATVVPPTVVPPTVTPQPRALSGHVLDAFTGKPVAGAHLAVPGSAKISRADGTFDLGVVPPGAPLQVTAPGYAPTNLDTGSGAALDVTLRPTTLHGRITDAGSGKPLYGVLVRVDLPDPGATAPGPVTATATLTAGAALPVAFAYVPPLGATGLLTGTTATAAATNGPGATGTPAVAPTTSANSTPPTPAPPTAIPTPPPVMPTPFTSDRMILAVTDADGKYTLDNVPAGAVLTVKMPGYKLTKVPLARGATQDVALQPFVAKALYLTANAANYDPLYKPILDLADKTEINAIVLNIQDDTAHVVYDTHVPLAVSSGAVDKAILPNIKAVVAELHKHNLYVIGRMVTFMQPAVADANPQLAVRSKAHGGPWKGGYQAQQRWLDPTNPAARQYPLALANEAVGLGFDEIQFDYIRFPSDPAPGETWEDMSFSQPADDTTKPQFIQQFVTEAHNMLNMTDAFMSVDIFGYTVWPDQNGLPLNRVIGQVFERMIGHTDYVSPMIYPSHFSAGELGFPDPNAHPYEIIKQAGIYTDQRIVGQRAKYRPWLQGFDWNHLAYDGRLYRLQIQAAEETGAAGWLFWDPSNVYSGDGFLPER